jgi:hypothetical protein
VAAVGDADACRRTRHRRLRTQPTQQPRAIFPQSPSSVNAADEFTRAALEAVIIEFVADAGDGVFEPVLSYLGWWDCPRSGVALVGGQPYYFDCQFSEELDDYPGQFRLWPVPDGELAVELEVWQMFADWRDEYDSGLRPPPFPGDLQSPALDRVLRRHQRQPPPDARVAIPEWRLDPDRSFAGRIPTHRVRWTFVG